MTLEDAQAQALIGVKYGQLYEALTNECDRRMFQAWWPWATAHLGRPASSQGNRKPDISKLPASGNPCKTCGGMMVRGGKCEYCPNGCGSEGECS